MSQHNVRVIELAAWGLDDYSYRPACVDDPQRTNALQQRLHPQADALMAHHIDAVQHLLDQQSLRADLIEEMQGLQWELGIIDLRCLIAFQRRLVFNTALPTTHVPAAHDWEALTSLAFAAPTPALYTSTFDSANGTVIIHSSNPNLHIRKSNDLTSPLQVHTGSPFFEAASFRNRWFLRDGYHRAYSLLRAGVYEVPAVIVRAKSLQELGAVQPWFFSEDILFSDDPPRVSDFLNDSIVISYDRAPLTKTIRITIDETLSPASPTGDKP